MFSHKTIFISSLDWGLGHATRCVPIIRSLSENNTVIIGVTELNRSFFDGHFPSLKKLNLPSYNIVYSKYLPVWLKIALQSQKIRAVIKTEHEQLKQIVCDHKIDCVISDNRFGLHHPDAETIFITHQLNIHVPLFSAVANKINQDYIHQFDKVWVPDHEDKNLRLSGQLSDSKHIKIPVEYIGPQSALSDLPENRHENKKTDYLILLSGTEPQRTVLEKILVEKFSGTTKKVTLLRGSNTNSSLMYGNIKVIDFATGIELKELIVNAETVICRSGYSTLMDLYVLGKKQAVLIPTPGQPEQEYLAAYWSEKFSCRAIQQNHLLKAQLYQIK